MSCSECVMKRPCNHAEPWQCPDCGLRWAVLMPGVRRRSIDLSPPMEPEREDAIELLLCAADAGWFAASRFEDGPSIAVEAVRKVREALLAIVWRDLYGEALLLDGWNPGDEREALLAIVWRDLYGEAAGLLLDGWNPGDEVVRR